jgi:hypothetical protein
VSILRAKRAIMRAGFQSGVFKPKAGTLTVEVHVPVCFTDFDGDDESLRGFVWDEIVRFANQRRIEILSASGNFVMQSARRAQIGPIPPEHLGVSMAADRPADLRTAAGREWKRRKLAAEALA